MFLLICKIFGTEIKDFNYHFFDSIEGKVHSLITFSMLIILFIYLIKFIVSKIKKNNVKISSINLLYYVLFYMFFEIFRFNVYIIFETIFSNSINSYGIDNCNSCGLMLSTLETSCSRDDSYLIFEIIMAIVFLIISILTLVIRSKKIKKLKGVQE